MRRTLYKKLERSKEEYRACIDRQHGNGNYTYREHIKGGRKNLYVFGHLISTTGQGDYLDIGGLDDKKFFVFIRQFNKSLYNRLKTNPELMNLVIPFKGLSKKKNIATFKQLQPGEIFYNVDIKKAYWQSLFKTGYISEPYFTKYFPQDAYKQAMRYCVSFLVRENRMKYHTPQGIHEIKCDISAHHRIYENVRNYLHSLIYSFAEKHPYIEYNIDGITTTGEYWQEAKDHFNKAGIVYKTTLCRKHSDTHYYYGSKLRKF